MAFKITWTPEALKTYLAIIYYLETTWTEREVRNFVQRVENKIALLKKFSGLGSPFDKRRRLRKTLVHPLVQLYYRVNIKSGQIELVTFWNVKQNPKRLRKLKK